MATSKRARIVLNPSARSARARRLLARALADWRQPAGARIELVESRSAEHFRELVASAQDDDYDAIGLAGGDGTVALALSALREPNRVPLVVLPVGSGNDFAKGVGAPLDAALGALVTGERRWVDVARVDPGGARFCCVASLGLDQLALEIVHGSRFPRSKALNMYASLRGLLAYRPRPLQITWQGGEFAGDVMFAAVTNTRSYGGGFMVSPDARIDDGQLDLCIVKRSARTRLLRSFPRILEGTHAVLPVVVLSRSAWVRIESPDEPCCVSLDGELPRQATPFEIHCEPRALQVLVPASSHAPAIDESMAWRATATS
jgi:diacylglycerol kinase (ATP)